MKRSVRLLLVLALLVLSTLLATACAVTPPPNDGGETVTYTVALVLPEGVTVEGDNPQTVAEGEDASFVITLPERTIFRSAEGAGYDASTGTLTVPNVTADMRVILEVEEVDYDVDADVRYFFSGASTDTTSQPSNTSVKFGTQITVEARDEERQFVGWVFDNNSDRIVSTERTFTFRVTPDIAKKSAVGYRITLTPKYIDLGTFYYNANGGVVDSSTVCMQDTQYQDVTFIGTDSVRVKLSKTYLSYLSCATTFWNDGTFTREGYVLKEFNTAADGSGEAYSPGTKVYPFVEGSESFTLYCIWEPFEASDFTYEPLTMPLPDVTATEDMPEGDARLATHWRTEGVIITGYTGADKATIALPDTLGGRPVIAIGAGVLTNLDVQTLVLPRHIQRIADGAVTGCDKLSTIYYPNSVYEVGDAWLDAASYTSFKTLVLTATMAPRYSNDEYGDFSLKLSRILSTMDRNRIIVISGSSSYQGLASAYMQDLFDGDYAVINFGTTRTSHCLLYLEAMQHYAHEGDVVIYSPENSTFLMGDRVLYWKTFRDLEGMMDIYRYVDISNYDEVFSSLAKYNQGVPYDEQSVKAYYARTPVTYEDVCQRMSKMNKYGDYIHAARDAYAGSAKYYDTYLITLNKLFRNHHEGKWSDASKLEEKNDITNTYYWSDITAEPYVSMMRHAVERAKTSGAKVYFGFCPTDKNALLDGVDAAHLAAYDALMRDTYGFENIVGTSADYVYDHLYFYDCAFHVNNYGRMWHTYNLYTDICELLNRDVTHTAADLGTDYEGCRFERDAQGRLLTSPKYPVTDFDE